MSVAPLQICSVSKKTDELKLQKYNTTGWTFKNSESIVWVL